MKQIESVEIKKDKRTITLSQNKLDAVVDQRKPLKQYICMPNNTIEQLFKIIKCFMLKQIL